MSDLLSCDRCGAPTPHTHRCAHCTFTFCDACFPQHEMARLFAWSLGNHSTFCDVVYEAAVLHCQLRIEDETFRVLGWPVTAPFQPDLTIPPREEDFAFARTLYASTLRAQVSR